LVFNIFYHASAYNTGIYWYCEILHIAGGLKDGENSKAPSALFKRPFGCAGKVLSVRFKKDLNRGSIISNRISVVTVIVSVSGF